MTLVCDEILALSTAVRTNVLDDVNRAVEGLKCDLDGVLKYSTNIKQWLKPVIDLTDFHVYPMNGITEGLNWWMAKEHRSIYMDEGDYQWVVTRDSLYEDAIKYISVPSSIDGNMKHVPTTGAVALDLAYVASGRLDGFFQNNLNLWDVAAGKLIVEEAGGKININNSYNVENINIKASSVNIYDKMVEKLINF